MLQTQSHDSSLVLDSHLLQESLDALAQDSLAGPEQSLVIESMAVVRDQKGRNVQSLVSVAEEDVGLDVPHGVSSGVAGLSEAAGGEAGAVALALEQVGGVEVAVALRLHVALAEKVVQVEECLLLF